MEQALQHRYLFMLEVAPVVVGKTYQELPSHLTLMSRFWSHLSPDELTETVRPLFEKTESIELLCGQTTQLGPKKLTVHIIEPSREIKQLHGILRAVLDSANVDYEYPQFIGEGHKPHVTKRDNESFKAGDKRLTSAAYLIEVIDEKRVVCSRFELRGNKRQTAAGNAKEIGH